VEVCLRSPRELAFLWQASSKYLRALRGELGPLPYGRGSDFSLSTCLGSVTNRDDPRDSPNPTLMRLATDVHSILPERLGMREIRDRPIWRQSRSEGPRTRNLNGEEFR